MQPAVPAVGKHWVSTEWIWCQRAPMPEVVPLHSYPRRGLTKKSNVSSIRLSKEIAFGAPGRSAEQAIGKAHILVAGVPASPLVAHSETWRARHAPA
eukprot:gene10212-biopygen9255